jgi:hypothetical protein
VVVADRHLAQCNVARLRDPLDQRVWREFLAGLDRVNRRAERGRGFVWRLEVPEGHVIADGAFVNLSLWESYEALHAFVYYDDHGHYARRRSRWFEPVAGPTTVLWWVPEGHRPSLEEAKARLEHVRRHGPSPWAFSLRRQFDADGRVTPRRTSPDRTSRGAES